MRTVTVDEVAAYPWPGLAAPTMLRFAPQSSLITYLDTENSDLHRVLFAVDPVTNQRQNIFSPPQQDDTPLPLEEQLRRERLRERGKGVSRYQFSPCGRWLMVPMGNECWIQRGMDGPRHCLVTDAINPTFSPDGDHVAFVRDGEIHIIETAGGQPRVLTSGPPQTTRGLAEYIAQEEMGRMRGFWWSPDGASIAFVDVDERHIPPFPIIHQGKDRLIREEHAYPFAGAANAKVKLGVVNVQHGHVSWMQLDVNDEPEDIYVARVHWRSNGGLWAELQDRSQQRLDVVCFDLQSGEKRIVFTEHNPIWINLHRLFWDLGDGHFLWGSERSGFRHLYLYADDGNCIRSVTTGDWMVESIAGLDAEEGTVYVTGTLDSPLEKHLYAVGLDGGEPRKITSVPGMHQVTVNVKQQLFIDAFSNRNQPPQVTLNCLQTGACKAELHRSHDPRVAGLQPPSAVTIHTAEGIPLHGNLYLPVGKGPYPLVVMVYGGPRAQRVQESWGATTADMRAQHLRGQGFAVFKLDNRGSARRGLNFEEPIKWNMGHVEVIDQIAGVQHLIAEGIADANRVGIMGWSYGGYMALMCLAQAPHVFAAASAGAPVTHWKHYDTHYTERYMGRPDENPEGYERSSVYAHVDKIEGELQLIHGLIDENVLFRNSVRLIHLLNQARKPVDMLLFPNERHMPRGKGDLVYLQQRVVRFFQRSLPSSSGAPSRSTAP